ncbi:MAG: AEC family transporter [Fusobacteriaceae bacterium]|nr:AEC family transporter [Fusobacteriaceae bacterium]
MINFSNLIILQCTLFIYMSAGWAATKLKILNALGIKCITDLVICIVLPCNIITSFYVEMDFNVLLSTGKIFLIAFMIQLMQLGLSKILFLHMKGKRRKVMEYGTICSNAGYLGNPVVEGIYGTDGLLYASVYLIPARLFLWSAGLACFTATTKKEIVKNLAKHPCIIAVEIGLILMIFQIHLPIIIEKSIRGIGNCSTFLSMFTIGGVISNASMKTLFSKDNFYYCFVRLCIVPVLALIIGLVLHFDLLLLGISVILAGMPAGTTMTLLASKYEGDADFASKATVLSTVFSMGTIPLLCILLIKLKMG